MPKPRTDVFGVKVEVGDIVLSVPNHKYAGQPTIGKVTGVFKSGRVTMKRPAKVRIYAWQRGAPNIEKQGKRAKRDERGQFTRSPEPPYSYEYEDYTWTEKDYTVVGHEWKWEKVQAADVNLIVLRKDGEEYRSLKDVLNVNELTRAIEMDYDTERPEPS